MSDFYLCRVENKGVSEMGVVILGYLVVRKCGESSCHGGCLKSCPLPNLTLRISHLSELSKQ